jgi:nitroreductase
MELKSAIKNRRSVRKFLDKKIEPEIIRQIIEAAVLAPSACNIQGWRFIVVQDQKLKEEMVKKGSASFIKNAPLGILVAYDQRTDNTEYQDHIQSASAAIQNLLLAAFEQGLGSCWICQLPTKKELSKLFNIPSSFSPIAYIALGYPAQNIEPMPRKYEIDRLIGYNQFPNSIQEAKTKMPGKKLLRKMYFALPTGLKTILFPIVDKYFTKKFKN